MEAHIKNITKVVDDLKVTLLNRTFNDDTDSTLTQQRTIERYQYVVSNSVSYIAHIGYMPLS